MVVLPTPPFWLATARMRGSGRAKDETASSVAARRREAQAAARRRFVGLLRAARRSGGDLLRRRAHRASGGPPRQGADRGAGGSSGAGRSGGGGAVNASSSASRERRLVRRGLALGRLAAIGGRPSLLAEPLEDRPALGWPDRPTGRSLPHPARCSARAQGPSAMFHVEPSTCLEHPRCGRSAAVFHVEHGAQNRGAWPAARPGGGRSPGTRATWWRTCTVGERGGPGPELQAQLAPAGPPASAIGSGSGGSLTTSSPPTRSRGAAHSAVAAGGPKLRATTASASAAEGTVADHLGPTLDHRGRQVERSPRPPRGTGTAWPLASTRTRGAGPGARTPMIRPGTPPPLPRSTTVPLIASRAVEEAGRVLDVGLRPGPGRGSPARGRARAGPAAARARRSAARSARHDAGVRRRG